MDNQIIITVSGLDKVGIVAKITTELASMNINIEDIKQTLMQGHFVMFMLCSIENSELPFKDIKQNFNNIANELGMEIWVQKREIFDNMHKI